MNFASHEKRAEVVAEQDGFALRFVTNINKIKKNFHNNFFMVQI